MPQKGLEVEFVKRKLIDGLYVKKLKNKSINPAVKLKHPIKYINLNSKISKRGKLVKFIGRM